MTDHDPEWIEQVRADLHRVRQTFDSVCTSKKTLQHLNKALQSQVAALETERDGLAERVRVLREALEEIRDNESGPWCREVARAALEQAK